MNSRLLLQHQRAVSSTGSALTGGVAYTKRALWDNSSYTCFGGRTHTLHHALCLFVQELIVAEHEQMLMSIADRAEQALEAARRETAWPSRRVEAYPPGTFNLPPNELKAVRRAHHNRGGGL